MHCWAGRGEEIEVKLGSLRMMRQEQVQVLEEMELLFQKLLRMMLQQQQQVQEREEIELLFEKILEKSDLNGNCRFLIPKKIVINNIFKNLTQEEIAQVHAPEGIVFPIFDLDDGIQDTFIFRHWSSSKSYVFNGVWTKFVKRKSLKVGDTVRVWRDHVNNRFCINCSSDSTSGNTGLVRENGNVSGHTSPSARDVAAANAQMAAFSSASAQVNNGNTHDSDICLCIRLRCAHTNGNRNAEHNVYGASSSSQNAQMAVASCGMVNGVCVCLRLSGNCK